MPEAKLPLEVLHAPQLIRPGDTKIHQHEGKDEIVQIMALYALTPNEHRIPLETLADELNKDFPGLDISREGVRQFLIRYIVPAIYVPAHWIKQGIIEAGHDLNTARQKLEIAQKLKKKFDKDVEALPARDAAALGKATLDAISEAEDSMERYEVIPRQRTESMQTQVKVDVASVLSKMGGPPPITVPYRKVEEPEPTKSSDPEAPA